MHMAPWCVLGYGRFWLSEGRSPARCSDNVRPRLSGANGLPRKQIAPKLPSTNATMVNSMTAKKTSDGFTDEERAAMKDRAQELKAEARRRTGKSKTDGESDVLAKIAEMEGSDRTMAERLHSLIKTSAPRLASRTWYGMPAYARDGKVICFFQSAQKFKSRYATLGFSDEAKLDEGTMWPTSFALKKLTAAEEKRISALVKKAVS